MYAITLTPKPGDTLSNFKRSHRDNNLTLIIQISPAFPQFLQIIWIETFAQLAHLRDLGHI